MTICPHCGVENSPLVGEKLTHCLACGRPLYIPEQPVKPPPEPPGENPKPPDPGAADGSPHGLSFLGAIGFFVSAIVLLIGFVDGPDLRCATGFLGCLLSLIVIGLGMIVRRLDQLNRR